MGWYSPRGNTVATRAVSFGVTDSYGQELGAQYDVTFMSDEDWLRTPNPENFPRFKLDLFKTHNGEVTSGVVSHFATYYPTLDEAAAQGEEYLARAYTKARKSAAIRFAVRAAIKV